MIKSLKSYFITLLSFMFLSFFLLLNSSFADEISTPLSRIELPDVTVDDIYCQGSTTNILSIVVKNLGPGNVPSDVGGGLYIWIDGKLEWTYSWNTWASQDFRMAGMTSVIQPQVLSAGTHTIKACMDPNNELAEVSESNNCMEKVIDCGVASDQPVPEPENCVSADLFYRTENINMKKVELGDVVITAATMSDGTGASLSVTDCSQDDNLDVFIPWSEASASEKAQILMPLYICSGLPPVSADITLIHLNYAKFTAFDLNNNVVDVQNAGSQSTLQTVTLHSATGISRIEVEGSEICIREICWECGEIEHPVDQGNCVTPGEFYEREALNLTSVNLGGITISAAMMSDGTGASLSVMDCSNDNQLDVFVPWTEDSASKKAQIILPSELCETGALTRVEIYLTYGTNVKFTAFDDNNNVVDSVTGITQNTSQVITLNSPSNIARIEMTGSEICISKICWECGENSEIPPDGGECDEESLRRAYEAGYKAGLEAASSDYSDCECATFNFITNTFHVPCFDAGSLPTYWLEMELINSDPVRLELKKYGNNTP